MLTKASHPGNKQTRTQTIIQTLSNRLVSILTIGFISVFIAAALFDLPQFSNMINTLFRAATKLFGTAWQWLMLANFILALAIAASRYGRTRMGLLSKPNISTFKWLAMIMCTLLAGGGVFWSAAEPIYHFITPASHFSDVSSSSTAAISPALAQSFLHWGFLAWAILGTLATIVLMYAHHQGGVKLRPRALLYPLVGDKLEQHWLGSVIDACAIIGVAAGTIGPIGFLASQLGYSLEVVANIDNNVNSQIIILAVVVTIYSLSAVSGMDKGLQWLSRANVIGALVLLLVFLIYGPTTFIVKQFGISLSNYLTLLPTLSLENSDPQWNSWWTWFFWGWFIGFAPMMAIFIARISEGRTIRELVFAVAIGAPLATNFWFAALGGTGIFFELQLPGSISTPLANDGLPAVLLATLSQMPFNELLIPAFLLLTTTFVVTTGDSMAYAIAMVVSGDNQPSRLHRLFWAVLMGAVAGVLLLVGDGGLNALQSFIVITAVPVSLLMAATLVSGPIAAIRMHNSQSQIANH